MSENYINHIALVLDAGAFERGSRKSSGQPDFHTWLNARRSWITVYVFNDTVTCVIYDKDVLRRILPPTRHDGAQVALTPEVYGDHAVLENRSTSQPLQLATKLNHWTVAVLVPDQTAKFEAKKFGFPADNIAVWDATSMRLARRSGARQSNS